MNQTQFEEAKKRFESYDLRVKNPELSVDAAYNAVISNQVRTERNNRLASSDYRMVSDAPWPREPWVTYRQALRDIPSSEGFPHNVVWPVEPS